MFDKAQAIRVANSHRRFGIAYSAVAGMCAVVSFCRTESSSGPAVIMTCEGWSSETESAVVGTRRGDLSIERGSLDAVAP